jgi:Transposase DDE domain
VDQKLVLVRIDVREAAAGDDEMQAVRRSGSAAAPLSDAPTPALTAPAYTIPRPSNARRSIKPLPATMSGSRDLRLVCLSAMISSLEGVAPVRTTSRRRYTKHTSLRRRFQRSADRGWSGHARMIVRHFYEDAREAMHQRAASDPVWMEHRREMVEHPYVTIKWLMGHPRFVVRGLKKATVELALAVMSYNVKRVINILGVTAVLRALQPLPS